MLVELTVRWAEMRIRQTDQGDAELKKLLDGESSPEYTPEFYYEFAPMVFDLNDVARFNRSHDKKSTTLRMKDGDSYVVDLPYEDFKQLHNECTGKSIVVLKKLGGGNDSTTPGVSGSDFDVDSI